MSEKCWSCGVDQTPRKPHRDDFDSEQAYLIACLVWLDYSFPKRHRAAEWARLKHERETETIVDRLRYFADLDEMTPAQRRESDRLMTEYRARRDHERELAARAKTTKKKESNRS